MKRMPSTPAMRSSMIWVIRVSTTLADAPGYRVSIETIGASMSGYSRKGKRSNATSPKMTSISDRTDANTGRFMDVSDNNMAYRPDDAGALEA